MYAVLRTFHQDIYNHVNLDITENIPLIAYITDHTRQPNNCSKRGSMWLQVSCMNVDLFLLIVSIGGIELYLALLTEELVSWYNW